MNAYSKIPVTDWVESWVPYLNHFHIHNNDSSWDQHNPLNEGTIDMKELLEYIDRLCPDATIALELMKARTSAQWLILVLQSILQWPRLLLNLLRKLKVCSATLS